MKSNILIAVLILNLLSFYSFAQTTYYVSTSGNDSNNGTSISTAFESIQKGINTASAEDVVEIMAGTYTTGTIWLDNKHGDTENIIIIKNYQNDIVKIDGSNLGSDKDLFYLENTSYITIRGLIIENNEKNNASGFNIQGNCQYISILNCEIRNINFDSDPDAHAGSSNNAYPLIVYASDGSNANTNILISNNKIHDCRTGWSEGLALNGNIDGFEVSGNEVYNISNIGIDAIGFEGTASSNDYARNGLIKNNIVHDCPSPYADCGGIYVDGGRDIIIENNTCYNNQYGIEIGNEHSGTTTKNIIVRNNIFYSNTLVGIKIGGYEGDVTDCSLTGNVCFNNNTDNAWRGELELSDKLTNTEIKNNIFYAKNTDNLIILAEGTEQTGVDLNYNIFYHSAGSSGDNFDWYGSSFDGNFNKFQETGHGSNSYFTDPLFVNLESLDFHIQSASPAIDAGDPAYISVSSSNSSAIDEDIDGQTRIYNSIIDCGVDEFSSNISENEYYVSPSGNNANDGSLASPFATIQHAVDVATEASTVYIMAGAYTENIVMNTNSGTSEKLIVFTNYSNDVVYIDGGGISASSGDALWSITDVNYITIDGLIFKNIINLWVKGLIINKNCNYITVTNCKFTDIHFSDDPDESIESGENANPLLVYSTDAVNSVTNITFNNNEIYNCRTGYSESMTINGNVDGFTLDNNYIHDVTNIGIVAAGHYGACSDPDFDQVRNGIIRNNILFNCASPVAICGALYVDGGKNIIVENNTTYNGQVGISIGCENIGKTTDSIIVRNNIAYGNSETGIEIGGYNYPSGSGKVTNSSIYGNTCFKNDTGDNWVGELWVNYCENLAVRNNIFYADNSNKVVFYYASNNGSGNEIDYNLYYTPTGEYDCMFTYDGSGYSTFSSYKSNSGNDANSSFVEPQFVETASYNFHLQTTSPAIDAGDPTYTTAANEVDMDGQTRIYNSIIDCGADEYSSTAIPALTVTPSSLSDYNYTHGAGPSLSKEVVLSGTNLDGSQVIISSPAHYEISLDNSSFSQSINIDYSNSTLNNTTIFVRLISGLSAGYYNNENLTFDDNGTAAIITVTLNGLVSDATGIKQNTVNAASWSMFAENQNIHILYGEYKQTLIQVFDMSGKMVKQQKVLQNHTIINLSVYEGIYVVKLIDKNLSDTKKVFIKGY